LKKAKTANFLVVEERASELGAELLKVLAHPVRLRLLALLIENDYSVGQLAEKLHLEPAIVSQHLRLLRMREVVAARREGVSVLYRLGEEKLRAVLQCLEQCLFERLA
jgi:DNA-binding transcriptional ArsR family regulator